MNSLPMTQHLAMLDAQRHLTTQRMAKIESIINDFHKIDSRFRNLTAFTMAIANKLRDAEKSSVSHTALLRTTSPYRKLLEKGWAKSNKIIEKNNKKNLEKIEMASRIRDLTQENNLKDKIIEKLQIEIETLRGKTNFLLTDKLPGDERIRNVFIPYKKLFDLTRDPEGYLLFDSVRKTLKDPITLNVMLAEPDFPDGFIEWFLSDSSKKR